MGNIFSSEEKLLRHQTNEVVLGRNPRHIVGLYEQYGYNYANISFSRPIEHRYRKRRNISFHGKYGKNNHYKTKSQSLNEILEELYSLGPEHYTEEEKPKINFENGRSLIPRIKLKRSTSSLKEEKSYKTLCKMTSNSEMFIDGDVTNSSPDITFQKENNDFKTKVPENNIMILLNDECYDKVSKKSDESYFAKNFDDCMKRLELIEKEHELIEKDADVEFCAFQKDKGDTQTDLPEVNKTLPTDVVYECEPECTSKSFENASTEEKNYNTEIKSENQPKSFEGNENKENFFKQGKKVQITNEEEEETTTNENSNPVLITWYSNLKQQFEKKEQEIQEQKTKEMSCRITGATLKNQNEKAKPENKEKDTRHYFHKLVKTNKSLIDEELPDPDKVKHIRAMFQETLNSTLKRKLDKKLGGSLQNISTRTAEQHMNRPLSAQWYRNDLFCDQKSSEENDKKTPLLDTSRPNKDKNGEIQVESTKRKLFEKYEKDLKPTKEYKNRRVLQPKWTDTGSVSSGISSDLSSYDTDLESISREGGEQDEVTISDDDLLEEVKGKHYVQNEVLEKIRSFGTSVTYYGGEMITCSVGPLLSPTTQAIMEEISEKYGRETNPARSFDEFYRKYVETNEHSRKKKLGRTRSFGQNDVFQKPNVLSNTEIEMYKNDLEIEIGIKKPTGIPQNSLKRKVVKSASLGNKTEVAEKNEFPVLTPESNNSNSSDTRQGISEETFSTACDIINKNVIKKNVIVDNASSETKIGEESENGIDVLEKKMIQQKDEKTQKTTEKEPAYSRSKSAPEGLSIGKIDEHPAKEIFFSYEKSIFNGKRNSDMEFEEFEVCESLSEKLEKLEKINSVERPTDGLLQEEVKKSLENGEEKQTKEILTKAVPENLDTKNEIPVMHTNDWKSTNMEAIENNQSEEKNFKYNYSRWPIETSVMVDIQKNNEQTPKLITNGKTVAKTKIRLF